MKYIISIVLLFNSIYAIEFGTLATASKSGKYYQIGLDISDLLKKYSINLKPIETQGSYENLDILNGNFIKENYTFFAIVQKDAISYYNYIQYATKGESVLAKIPAILSLGVEQIHILALEDQNFDFENRKTFKVYCGEPEGGSCITAKYIEKAYDFKFVYVNSKKENSITKLQNEMVDLIISVISAPSVEFKDLEGVDFIDLPTNFVMEDMYTHSEIKKKDYPWMIEDIHAFAVPKVLVTNLSDKKYNPIIENFIKIMVLNKKYLSVNYGEYWDEMDFKYVNYKKFSKSSKKVISSIR